MTALEYSPTIIAFCIATSLIVGFSAGIDRVRVLEFVSASGGGRQAIFILRAIADGTTDVWVSVIPAGLTASGVVAGGVSQSIQVTVGK